MLVTHRKASIDEIERAWHGDVETILKWVGSQERVEECAVLKTCNRVEIYIVSQRGEKVLFDLAKKARVSSRIIDFMIMTNHCIIFCAWLRVSNP